MPGACSRERIPLSTSISSLLHSKFIKNTYKIHSLYSGFFIMPLVVPGINSSMGDKSEWMNKLMGKKISDAGSNEIVS